MFQIEPPVCAIVRLPAGRFETGAQMLVGFALEATREGFRVAHFGDLPAVRADQADRTRDRISGNTGMYRLCGNQQLGNPRLHPPFRNRFIFDLISSGADAPCRDRTGSFGLFA